MSQLSVRMRSLQTFATKSARFADWWYHFPQYPCFAERYEPAYGGVAAARSEVEAPAGRPSGKQARIE